MERGLHMVNWAKITKPTRYGSLGVRNSRLQNTALLGKLGWEILQDSNKLWVQLTKDKYLSRGHLFTSGHQRGFIVWNSMRKAIEHLKDGFSFKVGDGETSFWFSPWIIKTPFAQLVPYVNIQDVDLKVPDVWQDEAWQL